MQPLDYSPHCPAPLSDGDEALAQQSFLLRQIVRFRGLIFLFLALLLLAGFNGQWRVGRDSSLYRDVARNLANGQGYTHLGQPERHIYPGLPLLLAGIDKVFGPQDPLRPTAALLIMMALAGLTLVVVYHLIKLHCPQWLAVAVTTGLGINSLFLESAHELMTDLPFLLGISLFLLGIARLSRAARARQLALPLLLALTGALLAVSTRPTFWFLALAWLATCLLGMLRSPKRLLYGLGLAAMLLLAVGWFLIDPRLAGHILDGKYEAAVYNHLTQLSSVDWRQRLDKTFDRHLPEAFFGFELFYPLGILLCPLLLLAIGLLLRRSTLWGLYVLVTLATTLLLGNVPRYYLMVMPLLLAAWGLFLAHIARRLARWRFAPDLVLLLGLGLVTTSNLLQSMGFVLEQRGITRDFERKAFLDTYRHGKMRPVVQLAQMIAAHVPQGQRVLGPEERITSYLSQRPVYHPADILPDDVRQWRTTLTKERLAWCAYSPRFSDEKRMKLLLAGRFIDVDRASLIEQDRLFLGRLLVVTPAPKTPKLKPPPKTRPALKKAPATRKTPITRRSTTRKSPAPRKIPATEPAPRG